MSIPRVTTYNAAITPNCSRVRERSVYQSIEKLERKMPINSPQEERHHVCSTSFFVLTKYQGNKKISLCRKGTGRKVVISIDLCLSDYTTYIYIN